MGGYTHYFNVLLNTSEIFMEQTDEPEPSLAQWTQHKPAAMPRLQQHKHVVRESLATAVDKKQKPTALLEGLRSFPRSHSKSPETHTE